MKKRNNLKDIALACGLSQSSVTYIMNGSDKYKFKPETVQLVRETARRLNYHPNLAASNLRKGRNNVIVGVMGNVCRSADMSLAVRLRQELHQRGYNLMLQLMIDMSDEDKVEFFREIHAWGAGLVIWSIGVDERSPCRGAMVELLNQSPPTIGLATKVEESCIDYIEPSWLEDRWKIGAFFEARGCKQVAYCISREEANLSIGEDFLLRNRSDKTRFHWTAPKQSFGRNNYYAVGQALAQEMLKNPGEMPDGIYCLSDEMAFSMQALFRDHGIRVPQDILMLGGGDSDFKQWMNPPLPYFGAAVDQVKMVAEDLVRRIENGDAVAGTGRCIGRVERDVILLRNPQAEEISRSSCEIEKAFLPDEGAAKNMERERHGERIIGGKSFHAHCG